MLMGLGWPSTGAAYPSISTASRGTRGALAKTCVRICGRLVSLVCLRELRVGASLKGRGETKDITYHYRVGDVENRLSRAEALKFETDEEYEVISPFSNKCKACSNNKK